MTTTKVDTDPGLRQMCAGPLLLLVRARPRSSSTCSAWDPGRSADLACTSHLCRQTLQDPRCQACATKPERWGTPHCEFPTGSHQCPFVQVPLSVCQILFHRTDRGFCSRLMPRSHILTSIPLLIPFTNRSTRLVEERGGLLRRGKQRTEFLNTRFKCIGREEREADKTKPSKQTEY